MLLTPPKGNTKLTKSQGEYTVVGLSLAPNTLSGRNVCASSSPECRKYCLNYTGLAVAFPSIIKARIRKTQALYSNPKLFLAQLRKEILFYKSKSDKLAVRLNVFSDIMWEKYDLFDLPVQFYDYTKHIKRYERWLAGKLPSNYHLTFSRSESNDKICLDFLRAGGNVSVVMPKCDTWKGFPVLEGDTTDLRFLDPPGHVIQLKPKGKLKQSNSNFVSIGDLHVAR